MKTYVFILAVLFGSVHSNAQINLVKDINSGTADGISNFARMVEMNNVVYFVGDTATKGAELWRSDGTTAGTYMVKDINPGATGSSIRYLYKVGNTIFMYANDGVNGDELWKTDGTLAGTMLVKNINTSSTSYFGTEIVASINNKFIFEATSDTGSQLWVSDGTAAGTMSLSSQVQLSSQCRALGVAGPYLYFLAGDNANGGLMSIFRTDGTPAETILLKTDCSGHAFNSLGNNAYMVLDPQNLSNVEIWKSDGTVAGTTLLKDICAGNARSVDNNTILYKMNNKLYFAADDCINGIELWSTDGTTAGTSLVKDINPGAVSSMTYNTYGMYAGVHANKFYFTANDGTSGNELWSTDGTLAGTQLFLDIKTGTASSMPQQYFSGNYFYFVATNFSSGVELYRSDGTVGGTILVKDIFPGFGSSTPSVLASASTGEYFSANDGPNGTEVWFTDGTTAGTNLVMDLNSGTPPSYPQAMTFANGYLIMHATTASTGRELYAISGVPPNAIPINSLDKDRLPYPNPNKGEFMIKGIHDPGTIHLFNLLGEEISFQSLQIKEGIKINLKDQPSGVYFVRWGSVTKKIIKE